MTTRDRHFRNWLEELKIGVIQGEYGYEEGEFTVYPSHWRPMFDHGLTPQEAFRRALDMQACGRIEDECLRAINWARICWEDIRV